MPTLAWACSPEQGLWIHAYASASMNLHRSKPDQVPRQAPGSLGIRVALIEHAIILPLDSDSAAMVLTGLGLFFNKPQKTVTFSL